MKKKIKRNPVIDIAVDIQREIEFFLTKYSIPDAYNDLLDLYLFIVKRNLCLQKLMEEV